MVGQPQTGALWCQDITTIAARWKNLAVRSNHPKIPIGSGRLWLFWKHCFHPVATLEGQSEPVVHAPSAG